jgi:hypothetical protein
MATARTRRSVTHEAGPGTVRVAASDGDPDRAAPRCAPKAPQGPVLRTPVVSKLPTRRPGVAAGGQKQLPKASRTCSVALLATLLASCGGGSNETEAVPLDTARLSCDVTDQATGKAVADANVTYQAAATEFSTRTQADGSCELDLPAGEVAGVAFPAGSVEKPGYEPQTILCSKLQGGGSCVSSVQIVPLADNVSIPVGGGIVMHLGDDLFEGAINSQFQKKTDGIELAFVIEDWAAKVKAGYTKATVYVDAKGWQTNNCNNVIALAGDFGTVTLPGGDSPSDGYWAGGKQVPFEFSVAQVGMLRAEVRVSAGTCNGTTDRDDFEINRMRVYFD